MNTLHTQAPEVKAIALAAFPSYNGRTFKVSTDTPSRLDSNWEGGSRDYFALVDMASNRAIPIPENGTPFSNGGRIFTLSELPQNIALVSHTIFCGKDLGLTVYVNALNMAKMIPEPARLTQAQSVVLCYTRERKSSYNGRNRQEMAFDDMGFPKLEWEQAKAELIASGLLRSNGALTDDGRNAASGLGQCWNLPKWQA